MVGGDEEVEQDKCENDDDPQRNGIKVRIRQAAISYTLAQNEIMFLL